MPETQHIGSHTTWFEEPDVIHLRLSGDVSAEESRILAREHLGMAHGRDNIFMLVDMGAFNSGTPAGRKITSEALTRMPVRGVAIHPAKLTAKVMAKLVLLGTKLFRRGHELQFPIQFFDDEAEAQNWIAERRAAPRVDAPLSTF